MSDDKCPKCGSDDIRPGGSYLWCVNGHKLSDKSGVLTIDLVEHAIRKIAEKGHEWKTCSFGCQFVEISNGKRCSMCGRVIKSKK